MKKHTLLLFALGISCLVAKTQNAPGIHTPLLTDAVPGPVDVTITVQDFNAIGGFMLTLLYDPQSLSYQNATPNAAIDPGNFSVSILAGPGGKNKIVISYPYGFPALTLADGSTLVTLAYEFTLSNQVNHSALEWYDEGPSCEFLDLAGVPLNDSPSADYYINGLVASQVAPLTYLPANTYYITGPVEVPVTVDDFNQIGSLSLTFEYDPAVMTYNATYSSPLPGLGASDAPASSGKRKIVIAWFGDPQSLPDGSEIISLDFTYLNGSTILEWKDQGITCEYTDQQYYYLWDSPTSDFYFDGAIDQKMAPIIKADTVCCHSQDMVVVPVQAWDFEDINSLSLVLEYDDLTLNFACATARPRMSGDFDAFINESDQLEISWIGSSGITLTDGSILFYLAFSYLGGTTTLDWVNIGPSCEFTTGPAYTPLEDLPTEDFYFDGLAEPGPGQAIWTGTSSSDWGTPANWQDGLIPDSTIIVLITTSNTPANWPTVAGTLTLGDQCRNIIMEGSSQLTVTDNLIIETGHAMEILNDAIIKTGGDWTNHGVFDPGNGTVEFFSNQSGIIKWDVHPGNSLQNYTYEAFSSTMSFLTSPTAGPTGDNEHSDVVLGFLFNFLGTDYDQVRINTNGWLSFNLSGEDETSGENCFMFFDVGPTSIVAPWWDDLLADGSSAITYAMEGTAPDRIFTIEWKDVLSYVTDATARLNFQVKLYETTNVIEFHYGPVIPGTHSPDESASLGIKGIAGGEGSFIEASTGSTTNVFSCQRCSLGCWPVENYRFSPPPNTDKEVFWKMEVTKTNNASLNITRDTHIIGITP